ncbi:MAG: TetR/AcrR family transcriptional regulator [Helicobacter sp.]|uniref:TetR/AcrR family transcriptional regulator n=1 Tax=Helicobacter sp. TaxID=218 RepID=UPI0023D2C1C2|nr:TetR/AcrR family transcriptional regulator [Helicobacter sp.]MDE7175245.1 TetR/AcrR family transcriptional regulator [Helicobacter sp.]
MLRIQKKTNKKIVKKESQGVLTKTNKIQMQMMQQKQTKILKVATDLFLKYGYQKTSLQMIVRQTGGSFATIYNIFGSKEDLFSKVMELNGGDLIESLNEIYVQSMDSNLEVEKYFYNIGLHLIRETLDIKNIAFMRLMLLECYDNPKFATIFNQTSNVLSCFFIKGIEAYKDKMRLDIDKKEMEECARILIHLVIEPYWMYSLMDSNYQAPKDSEIEYALKRAIKIFMLYLKHYKEIK